MTETQGTPGDAAQRSSRVGSAPWLRRQTSPGGAWSLPGPVRFPLPKGCARRSSDTTLRGTPADNMANHSPVPDSRRWGQETHCPLHRPSRPHREDCSPSPSSPMGPALSLCRVGGGHQAGSAVLAGSPALACSSVKLALMSPLRGVSSRT